MKFIKKPHDWLKTQSATDFLNELSKVSNTVLADLVVVTYGGHNLGTHFHEDVALEHARWLFTCFSDG